MRFKQHLYVDEKLYNLEQFRVIILQIFYQVSSSSSSGRMFL